MTSPMQARKKGSWCTLDSYEFSMLENIERTQVKITEELLRFSVDNAERLSNIIDLNNHLDTLLKETRHYSEVIRSCDREPLESY